MARQDGSPFGPAGPMAPTAPATPSSPLASGFTGDELTWRPTWTDRLDRDRTPSIPGHELAGVVTALGYGTTGLSVGQRVISCQGP
jgi:Alcohol dehydrogenase GroES-like domain